MHSPTGCTTQLSTRLPGTFGFQMKMINILLLMDEIEWLRRRDKLNNPEDPLSRDGPWIVRGGCREGSPLLRNGTRTTCVLLTSHLDKPTFVQKRTRPTLADSVPHQFNPIISRLNVIFIGHPN